VIAPLWTILIPTLGQREALFRRLLDVLLPQLDAHAGAVRVLAWRNNGSPSIGHIRDGLLAAVEGPYVSFIDDDDLVPEYYVDEIVTALASRPDHVGFKLEYSVDGITKEIVDHSLRYGRWHRNYAGTLVRHFTHIDPIKTEYARRGTFVVPRPGRAEDRHWVKQVTGSPVTETYIDKIMYYYLWREDTSAWQNPDAIVAVPGRPVIDHEHFAWHPDSDA
jgi:hypothetical protein